MHEALPQKLKSNIGGIVLAGQAAGSGEQKCYQSIEQYSCQQWKIFGTKYTGNKLEDI